MYKHGKIYIYLLIYLQGTRLSKTLIKLSGNNKIEGIVYIEWEHERDILYSFFNNVLRFWLCINESMPWVGTCNHAVKRLINISMVTYYNWTNALEITELHVAQGTDGMFFKIIVYVSIKKIIRDKSKSQS